MKKLIIFAIVIIQFGVLVAQEAAPFVNDTVSPKRDSINQKEILDEFVLGSEDQQKAAMLLNECIYTLTKVRLANNRLALE